MVDIIGSNGTNEIEAVIQKTQFENLDIITSNVDLSGLEVETADDSNRAFILKAKLTAYSNDSRGSYDYVLITGGRSFRTPSTKPSQPSSGSFLRNVSNRLRNRLFWNWIMRNVLKTSASCLSLIHI